MSTIDPVLIEIVDTLVRVVQRLPQDCTLQDHYYDQEQLYADLCDHAARLHRGDGTRLPELKFALLPTAPICEIAVSSGWGDLYAELANRFDELYRGGWEAESSIPKLDGAYY